MERPYTVVLIVPTGIGAAIGALVGAVGGTAANVGIGVHNSKKKDRRVDSALEAERKVHVGGSQCTPQYTHTQKKIKKKTCHWCTTLGS